MFHILAGDNNRAYRRQLTSILKNDGYTVKQAASAEAVLSIMETEYIDLIILGNNLEDMDAYELVHQLRDTYPDMPVIMLAARYELEGLKRGFQSGADEYLSKTVDEDEFLLRIRALLRRSGKNYEKRLQIGRVILDGDSMTVTREEDTHTLPKKEFWLLYKLLSYPGKIFTRNQLMDEIWGLTTETTQATLNVHINRLRKKFEDYPEFELKAVRGMGYKAEVHI